MLKKIAVTGGIASGKTTVCTIFQNLGAYVVMADTLVHGLLNPNTDLGRRIIEEFGAEAIFKEGQINRKALANIAFNNPQMLQKLEKMIHPAVLQKLDEQYDWAAKEKKYSSFVAEIPLLFEIGAQDRYDIVITVICDEEISKKRFVQAGFSESEYTLRMKRQWHPTKKGAKSQYVIRNNGTLEALRAEVVRINGAIQDNF